MHRSFNYPFQTAINQFREKVHRFLFAMVGILVFSQMGWAQQNLFNVPESSPFKGTIVSGLYYGNTNFLGAGNEVGWMTGIEYPIICEEFSFVADFISGTNSNSVAVIGAQWTFSEKKGWQVSLGAQLPSPGSGNDYGAVFELTKFPPSFGKVLAPKL
ncbi:MAG: hypothetical protein NTY15_11355 [Planctomycetota bacterium]|nr:hypothetical protein [Planctomycetota bacterium]